VDKSGAPLSGTLLAEADAQFSLELLGSATDGSTGNTTLRFDSGSVSVPGQILVGGRLDSDLYRIYLGADLLNYVSVKVYAYPNDASRAATGNFMLARILDLSAASAQANTEWAVTCTDSADSASQLDGFNYELSGQLSGTLSLSWQTAHVAISPLSLEELQKSNPGLSIEYDGSGATAGITFAVSADTPLYLLQFYRTAPSAANETLDAVSGYVWVSDFKSSDDSSGGDSDAAGNDPAPADPTA
jgi:hypothetical protein